MIEEVHSVDYSGLSVPWLTLQARAVPTKVACRSRDSLLRSRFTPSVLDVSKSLETWCELGGLIRPKCVRRIGSIRTVTPCETERIGSRESLLILLPEFFVLTETAS